ncbi:MAG: ABC transporter permease [Acidobacteria bacterium]|nr:MAG: ABC transporter permease [Acidobacteriota bacterium]
MLPRLVDAEGRWHAPFVFPLRLDNRLERRYVEDRSRRLPLVFFAKGRLVTAADESSGPWLPLGADSSGRDLFARLLYGARTSLAIALLAALAAVALGALLGGIAGYAGGGVDAALMWVAEFVLVLPAVYVVLVLRAAMPLVLPPWSIFLLMAGIFGLVGWPWVARGVRGIVAAERTRDYVAAAPSLGAGHGRLLFRHLLPACRPFLGVQVVVLVPAFILAEATLSFVGLGFPDTVPSWGSMLIEAADVSAIRQFPWTLAPAAGIFAVTLGANLALDTPPLPPRDSRPVDRT